MDDFRERLTAYQTAMSLARNMLRQGIISEDDYRKIDTIVDKKHGVSSCSIFRYESPKSLDNKHF